RILNCSSGSCVGRRFLSSSAETNTIAKIFKISGSDVGCKDYNGIPEIDLTSQTVGYMAFVQNLQQYVEYIRMRFFNFIKKQYCVRFSSYGFSKLSAFFISHVSRRRTYQSGNGEFLHIFTHVNTDKCIVTVEQFAGHYFCKLSLTNTCGTQEDKCTDRSEERRVGKEGRLVGSERQ